MANDLQSICGALDTALQSTLDSWQAALSDTGDGAGDQQALFCLYPKLVSHLSWALATLQGAEQSQAEIDQRGGQAPDQMLMTRGALTGCCPCCGGAGFAMKAGCSCSGGRDADRDETRDETRDDPRDDARDNTGADTGTRETRIVEETIIEETRNGRRKDSRRAGRRS
jgi:hypothetical protein